MPLWFTIIYLLGTVLFVMLWFGKQGVTGFAGYERYGLIYSALCLVGTLANMALLRGYRWGVPAQLAVWAATLAINVVVPRETGPATVVALLLAGLWGIDVYRNRRALR